MARLIVTSGAEKGREFSLTPDQTIGRLASNEISVPDTRMSRQNTRIRLRGETWWITDLGSKNGTFVNGERVKEKALSPDDDIRVGETHFSFVVDAEAFAEAGAPAHPINAAPSVDVRDLGSADEVRTSSDRALSFSRYAGSGSTKTSFAWLRQDLAQRDGAFRILVYVGIVLIAAGLFWLVQLLVAGS